VSSEDNLGRPITGPPEPPDGGYTPPTPPLIRDLNHIPVAYGRDAQTDCRTISDVDSFGLDGNIAHDGDHDDAGTYGGWHSDMNVTSLGTEKRRMGWDPLATPNMDNMGGPPRPANTSGTRGADDIGAVPPDGSMP
jgi:hypothetical protein